MMFEDLDDPNPPDFGGNFRSGVRERVRARRRRRMAVGGAAGAIVLGVSGFAVRTAQRLDDIDRIEIAGTGKVADSAGARTILLVGTDGAAELDRGGAGGSDGAGLTDTLLLARIDQGSGTIRLLSLPRDLDLAPADAPMERLNTVYAERGYDGLVAAVEGLGFDVDHVAAVDFTGFQSLVDAVGGLEVAVGAPLRDASTGLVLDAPGCRRLDGVQALALARARHLEVMVDGRWVPDTSGDIGRAARQREMLVAAMSQFVDQVPDPLGADRLAGWAQEHLVLDAGLGNADLLDLIRAVAALGPDAVRPAQLPTSPETRDDGAAVLRALALDDVVAWFGATVDVRLDRPAPTTVPGDAQPIGGPIGADPIGRC